MQIIYIPNFLSLLRIALIPVVIVVSSQNWLYGNYLACTLFLLASLTDFLDGYFARNFNAMSKFGSLLDLIADKLLITICLVWLLTIYQSIFMLIPTLIIISRELILSSLREFFAYENIKIEVSNLGKLKTTLQMISVSILILAVNENIIFQNLGISCLWLASLLSVLSMINYFKYIFSLKKDISKGE